MLSRAEKEYAPPAPKDALAKQRFSSSSPAQNGNIQEQFSKGQKSTQSIGGFTGYKNLKDPLAPKSANIRSGSIQRVMSAPASTLSSSGSSSRLSVFSKGDAFEQPVFSSSNPIDLTQDDEPGPLNKPFQSSHPAVHFDENDFDDDSDIDLNMEFEAPTPLPMAAPPKPQKPAAQLQTPHSLPAASRHEPHLSSTQVTWSSSPPSHKQTPPAEKRRREEAAAQRATAPPVEESLPRPKKRRTLPWLQEQAERDEIAVRREEAAEKEEMAHAYGSSPPLQVCSLCKESGHFSTKCPKKRLAAFAHTPQAKREKHTPWDLTASAVREDKKRLRDKQMRKVDQVQSEAAARHQKAKMTGLNPVTLSEEQARVKKLVVEQGKSVFFTGSAGTGKSVLMRSIIAELKKKYVKEPDRVQVTASTGLAACNIGGTTLHSFGGIGLGKEDAPALVKKIKKNAKARNRWLRTKVLIIDEVSMVDGELFDKLEGIARIMRNNGRPFGGIQLVVTGDFFQLPPVPETNDNKQRGIKFAFEAGTWPTAIHHTIGLTEVFRQKDPVFANMLNEMRLGNISEATVKTFKALNRKPTFEEGIEGTELFPTRHEVDNANAFRMRSLQGKIYSFEAMDSGTTQDESIREKMLANVMAPKRIDLKKGAQVMLIKNLDEVCVNGSLGKVIAFMDEVTFEQRVMHDGLAFDGEDGNEASSNSVSTSFSNTQYGRPNSGKLYPVVEFVLPDSTIRRMLMMPEDWKIENPNGEVLAQRSQLPLILAWALSIHKAQGQTLERVKIDLKKIFEKGQAYVALSRATSLAGLEVHNFDKSKVMAHPRVAQFYNSLYSVNQALKHPKVAKPKKEHSFVEEFAKAQKQKKIEVDFTPDEEELMRMYG